MADTYHAIKLYKTTANSTTSSKRVGINVTDSTVTTGYALYVNGAINITDSLKTNSLNTGDLVVTGSASFTNGVNGITAANVPNLDASKITSGTLGVNRIPALAASKITSGTLGVDRIPSLSTDKLTSGTLGVARGGTGRGTLTSNAVLTGNGTSAINMVATASGAAYATATNGALTFGTLPVAQGGTGATSLANITVGRATADASGNTITSTYLKLSGGTLTNDLTINTELPGINFNYDGDHYGRIEHDGDSIVITNYATNHVNYENYTLPTPGAITTNSNYNILTTKLTNSHFYMFNNVNLGSVSSGVASGYIEFSVVGSGLVFVQMFGWGDSSITGYTHAHITLENSKIGGTWNLSENKHRMGASNGSVTLMANAAATFKSVGGDKVQCIYESNRENTAHYFRASVMTIGCTISVTSGSLVYDW